MSNDKEFEETKVKSEIYIKSFGHISNLEERGLAQDAFSTAWDYQQKIIEQKDKEIDRYRKALEFYANEMSYSTDDYRGISGEMITRCVLYSDCEERNNVYSYAGRRARQALSEVKNG